MKPARYYFLIAILILSHCCSYGQTPPPPAGGGNIPFTLLPNRTLISFSGEFNQGGVSLKGTLSANHTYDKIIIERGGVSSDLTPIAEISILNTASSAFSFTYYDNSPAPGVNYYRIRLFNTPQRIMEISNVMMVKAVGIMDNKDLQLFNTMTQGAAPSLTIRSTKSEDAKLMITDLNGHPIYEQSMHLGAGTTNVLLNNLHMLQGYGIAFIQTKTQREGIKIFIQ